MNLENMDFDDLIKHPIDCSCGRTHAIDLTVEIGSDALTKIPRIIKENGYKKVFLFADSNTYMVAGARVMEILQNNEITNSQYIIEDPELVPDEQAVGSILMHFDQSSDVIIAVGSGTVNDLARFVSFQVNQPYIIVATAPSMDGYASTVAPLITDSMKTTYQAHLPRAIIADLDIIANAPREMVAAGFGDILGKYTSLIDWKLAAIINDEYYCPTIVKMMSLALQRTVALQEGLTRQDKQAFRELMEALILAGIAMSYAGNSRPASGSEHHIAHFWEMQFLFQGRKPILHGTKVAIATVLVLKLHEHLQQEKLAPERIRASQPAFDFEAWEREIRRVFDKASAGVIQLEKEANKNNIAEHRDRIQRIANNWEAIWKTLQTLPASQDIAQLLHALDAPLTPHEIGIGQTLVQDSILYAKEIRSRYTTLQLLWDLDLLADYAEYATKL